MTKQEYDCLYNLIDREIERKYKVVESLEKQSTAEKDKIDLLRGIQIELNDYYQSKNPDNE